MLRKLLLNAKKFNNENKYQLKNIIYNDEWILIHDGVIQSSETNILYFGINNGISEKISLNCPDGIIIIYKNYIISLSNNIKIINMQTKKIIYDVSMDCSMDCSDAINAKVFFYDNYIMVEFYNGILEMNLKNECAGFVDDSASSEVLDEMLLHYKFEEKKIYDFNKKILCEINDSYNNFDELKKIIKKNYEKT